MQEIEFPTRPKIEFPNIKPAFEASIEILTSELGGRQTPPINGIRWDFRYLEDDLSGGFYMIYPYFLGEDDNLLPNTQLLCGKLRAWMYIIVEEMEGYHRNRISVGTKFYCVEGSHVVAHGEVTKLLSLSD